LGATQQHVAAERTDNSGLEEQVESLKHQLQNANQRIAALERRLNHLESSALGKKGYVAGA
jgi:septal ring factor EnvC (AmiA/AmiB activator)